MGVMVSWYHAASGPEFCGLPPTRGIARATGLRTDRLNGLGVRSLDQPNQPPKFAPLLS
jgi:hypothetical protein